MLVYGGAHQGGIDTRQEVDCIGAWCMLSLQVCGCEKTILYGKQNSRGTPDHLTEAEMMIYLPMASFLKARRSHLSLAKSAAGRQEASSA
jgi:hypothetical protein